MNFNVRFQPEPPMLCWLGLTAFLATCLFVNPLREVALFDDWAYARTVHHLVETGQYRLDPWLSANMPFQAYWGSWFAQVLGFSFGTLRIATLVLTFFGLVAFYLLAREHGLSPNRAGVLMLGLLASPLVVRFSFTFMTDVPFLMGLVISLWLYTRALRLHSSPLMFLASLATAATILTRQFGVAILLGLLVVWLLGRDRLRQASFFLVGLIIPLSAVGWQVAAGVYQPNWAADFNTRNQLLYLRTGLVALDAPWRLSLILQYLGLFLIPFVIPALAALLFSFSGAGRQRLLKVGLAVGLLGGLAAGVSAGSLVAGGPWQLRPRKTLVLFLGSGGLALASWLGRRSWHRADLPDGIDAKSRVYPLPLLGLLGGFLIAGIVYGRYWGGHLAEVMGKIQVYADNWWMPYLPWNFEEWRDWEPWQRIGMTLLTSTAALLFGGLILRRYRRQGEWAQLPAPQRLLDWVTLFLVLETLVYCHIGDEYLLVFIPYGLIVLGCSLGDWLDRLRVPVVFACLAVLALSAWWTRGFLEREQALWQAGEMVRREGVPPRQVSASWNWNFYYGAFDDYLASLTDPRQGNFDDLFQRWFPEQAKQTCYHLGLRSSNLTPESGFRVVGTVPYQDFFRRRHYVVIQQRICPAAAEPIHLPTHSFP